MSDVKTEAMLSSLVGSMVEACAANRDEQCVATLAEEVFQEVSFMGYSDEVAREVSKAAADKLHECVYVRTPVEDGLTEDQQRASCKEAAEAAGYVVTEE